MFVVRYLNRSIIVSARAVPLAERAGSGIGSLSRKAHCGGVPAGIFRSATHNEHEEGQNNSNKPLGCAQLLLYSASTAAGHRGIAVRQTSVKAVFPWPYGQALLLRGAWPQEG